MDYPSIAIIVPTYNEEKYIGRCLDSLLKQTYKGEIEILVTDGRSTDRTRDIVEEMMSSHSNIVLLDNPGKFQSSGRNVALGHTDKKLVAYIDGHSYATETWLENLYKSFIELKQQDGRFAGVGSIHLDPSDTNFSRATTVAFNSFLGGKTITSYSVKSGLIKVKWAYACLYDRQVLDEVGYYCPQLEKGEDLELNLRITTKHGYSLYVNPNAVTYYYKQESLDGLFTQMYKYGYWRYIVMKHLNLFSPLNMAPSLFIVCLAASFVLSFFVQFFFFVFFAALFIYFIVLVADSLANTIKCRENMMILFLIYICIHLGYGLGIIAGMMKPVKLEEQGKTAVF